MFSSINETLRSYWAINKCFIYNFRIMWYGCYSIYKLCALINCVTFRILQLTILALVGIAVAKPHYAFGGYPLAYSAPAVAYSAPYSTYPAYASYPAYSTYPAYSAYSAYSPISYTRSYGYPSNYAYLWKKWMVLSSSVSKSITATK